jgi:hypothetical protein
VPDSLGSSLAEEIEHLASDVRDVPREAATQRARTAPVKMLFHADELGRCRAC